MSIEVRMADGTLVGTFDMTGWICRTQDGFAFVVSKSPRLLPAKAGDVIEQPKTCDVRVELWRGGGTPYEAAMIRSDDELTQLRKDYRFHPAADRSRERL